MFARIGTALAVVSGVVVFIFLFLIALGTCIENIDNEAETTSGVITSSDVERMSEEDRAKHERWIKQHKHWDNVKAFDQHIKRMREDKVMDQSEVDFSCSVAEHWAEQLKAAQVYVQEYRRVEPDMVAVNPQLGELESIATKGYELVSILLPECARTVQQ